MPSTDLQTRVILSAEDRGIVTLLNRLRAETDLFIDKFSKVGGVITSALGNFGVGYGVRQAMKQIDDLRMDINAVAVTLTDTVKGSEKEIQQAFAQNQRHAEMFFKTLRRQAAQSISDFGDLRKAYSIMSTFGVGMDVTDENIRMLANVVDRIKLATRGQASNIQIMSEMRALMTGRLRPSDEMARIFQTRDANFSQTIRGLVSKRDSHAILEYLNSLLSDIDLGSVIGGSLMKQRERLKTEVSIWAEETFRPMYDVFTSMYSDMADSIMSRDNPLFKGMESMAKTATNALGRIADGIKAMDFKTQFKYGTNWLAVLTESLPKLAGIALGAKTAATALGLLVGGIKSSIAAMNTIPGAITVGVMGYTVARQYAASGNAPRYADDYSGPDPNGQADRLKFGMDIFLNLVKETGKGILSILTDYLDAYMNLILTYVRELAKIGDWLIYQFERFFNAVGNALNIDALKSSRLQNIDRTYNQQLNRYNEDSPVTKYVKGLLERNPARNPKDWEGYGTSTDRMLFALSNTNDPQKLLQIISKYTGKPSFLWESIPQREVEKNRELLGGMDNINRLRDEYSRWAANTEVPQKEQVLDWSNIYAERYMQAGANLENDVKSLLNVVGKSIDETYASYMERFNKSELKPQVDGRAVTGKPTAFSDELEKSSANALKDIDRLAKELMRVNDIIDQLSSRKGETGIEGAVNNALGKFDGMRRNLRQLSDDLDGMPESYQEFHRLSETINDLNLKLGLAGDEIEKAEITKQLNEYADALKAQKYTVLQDLQAMREAKIGEAQQALANAMKNAEAEARRAYAVKEADKAASKLNSLSIGQDSMFSWQTRLEQHIRELETNGADVESEASALQRKLNYERQYNALREKELDFSRQELEYAREMSKLHASGGAFDAFAYGLKQYAHDAKDTFNAVVGFANDAANAMHSSLSDGLYKFFKGDLSDFRSLFQSFCDSILKAWSDMIAQMIVKQASASIASSAFGSSLGSFFSGLFGGGSTSAAAAGSVRAGGTATMQTGLLMANGGILQGGFRAFASGGIATAPTLGLVGEGRYNEAIVPLPDGRSIPVIQRGTGKGNVIVNITDNSGTPTRKTVNQSTDETGNTVLDIVIDALGSNRRNFRNIMRGALA